MIVLRALLAVLMLLLGAYILAEMLAAARTGGWEIIPGLVLGGAMLLLGVHRLRLIARVRRTLR
jgi:hypothetical protein